MTKNATTDIETARFVKASALFKGLQKVWDRFVESEPDFSWGNNNRTLVDPKAILDHMDGTGIDGPQVTRLRKRAHALPRDVYVDLEN